jgi:hypothetical protein
MALVAGPRYGFIIMDGNGSLFGTLSGNTREVFHKFTVDLPKKHGRGGQSALRFARLRMEKRHNYVRKVGCNHSSPGWAVHVSPACGRQPHGLAAPPGAVGWPQGWRPHLWHHPTPQDGCISPGLHHFRSI